ncbi:MAG: PTS sugar transporter subunit IIB, partial [Bacilli bacterium]
MSRIKVITVCGFGIGTSLILKMNVEKVLVENGFDVEVSPIDVTSAPSEQCDIAFTSQEISSQLEGKLKVPMIII